MIITVTLQGYIKRGSLDSVKKQKRGGKGKSSIRDINREYGWKLPDDEATTIAGLIIHETRSIPKKGSVYSFHGFRFKILDRQRNQITSIRIQKEI